MVPDYQLEDTERQAAMERNEREPKERCFKCGAEIEPEELIEYYDLPFCSQGCLERAMECPECGEPAEQPGDYCAGCAEKNRIYTMSDAEFWGEASKAVVVAAINGLRVQKKFYHWPGEIELIWEASAGSPIRELTRLFEARGLHYELNPKAGPPYTEISIYLIGGKYREA